MASSPLLLTFSLGSISAGVVTGVTTGTGPWIPVLQGPQDIIATYTSVGTTSGGTILWEETDDPGSGATPSQIESVAASSFTGGAKTAHHVRIGAGIYIRHRISSTITGTGTIYVTVAGS